jgi:hypothetical protein
MKYLGASVAVVIAALSALSGCETSHACTLIGCVSQASAVVPLSGEPAPNSMVTACYNDACATGTVLGGAGDEPIHIEFIGHPDTQAQFRFDLGPQVQITWILSTTAHDGDRFSVDVVDAAGVSVAHFDSVAAFTTVNPNGPECVPTCQQAVLQQGAR